MKRDVDGRANRAVSMARLSARQRVIVVTFRSAAAAEAWDALANDSALDALADVVEVE